MRNASVLFAQLRRILARLSPLALCSVSLLGPLLAQSEVRRSLSATPPDSVEWTRVLDLQKRLGDIRTEPTSKGGVFLITTKSGTLRLTPQEFYSRLHDVQVGQRRHGYFYVLLNITTPWGCLWVGIGLLGQLLFTLRMMLQWYASEREGRSVVPVGFWWGSLFGGLMLFAYFIWRKDIVGILGQSTGLLVYARNLILIYRPARHPVQEHASAIPVSN